MIHHYITKYRDEKDNLIVESWMQINLFGKSFCFSKKLINLGQVANFSHVILTNQLGMVLDIWQEKDGFKGLCKDGYECNITYSDQPIFGDEQFTHQEIFNK